MNDNEMRTFYARRHSLSTQSRLRNVTRLWLRLARE